MSARQEHNGLAVHQCVFGGQGGHRRRDVQKPAGEICPVSAPYVNSFALLPDECSESVVLDLVQPARPGGRISDEVGRQGRMKPAGGSRRERG